MGSRDLSVSVGTILIAALLGSGCSWIFFERVPNEPYAPCDAPTCSGRALPSVDTVLAGQAAAYSLASLIVGLAGPTMCLDENNFLCMDVSGAYFLMAGVLAVPALVHGLSAGFGHAWAQDCEGARDRHQAWLDQQAPPPLGDRAEALAALPAPGALKHPVDDVACPPGTRALGKVPPAGFERTCGRLLPAGVVVHDGPARSWYEDGRLASEGTYREGVRHGRWTFWYANGQVRLEATYDRGQKVGAWKRWSRDGRALEQQ